jgi:hypothetical protein
VHKDIIWLRIPVAVPADSDGEWILNIDYAVLNRMDVYVATDGQIRAPGDRQPAAGSGARAAAAAAASRRAANTYCCCGCTTSAR